MTTTIADVFPDLGTLITSVASQAIDPTKVSPTLADLMPIAGRANLRSKSGSPKSAKVEKVETIETLTGEATYERPNGTLYYSRTWGEHADIEVLRNARKAKHYVLLYGAPGCGKTALVEGAFGEELETIIGSGDTELSDFIGGYVQTPSGGFEWIDGALVRAVEHGKVLLIDEIGLIDPKVLSAVYGLMDGRDEITITQNPERGTIKAKEGFYVIGATNPNAVGVRLSEALLSRFTIQVEMTTDWSLAKKLGVPAPAITASQNLAKKQASNEISWSPQFRELLAFREIAKTFGTRWAVANLVAVAPEMDRAVVADVFTRVFGEEVKPAKI